MKLKRNIGTFDRVARIVLGAVMLAFVPLVLVGSAHTWAWFGLLGLVPLAAGLTGYCPPYALLGIDTYRDGARQASKNRSAGAEVKIST